MAQCSVDCVGPSCQSIKNMEGACVAAAGDESTCLLYGSGATWYLNSICVMTSIEDEESCREV